MTNVKQMLGEMRSVATDASPDREKDLMKDERQGDFRGKAMRMGLEKGVSQGVYVFSTDFQIFHNTHI